MSANDPALPTDADKWERRFRREREARQTAESYLELRSRELYEMNRDLEVAKEDLERRVNERTDALQQAIKGLREEALRRKATEDALRVARDEALEGARLKSDFLARMSHDIRTPLNAIIGLTGLMSASDMDAKQAQNLETVRASGQLLLRIVNDILDMSKIEAGTLDLEFATTDLDMLLRQAFSLMLLDAQAKGVELVQQCHTAVPSSLVIDGGRLQQILMNLLSNAIKYSSGGTVTLHFTLTPLDEQLDSAELRSAAAGKPGEWQKLTVAVADEGSGIAPDELDALFEPFTRLERESDENAAGSAGLGLAICRGLCELMGGRITATSQPGKGSRFTVTLPCFLPETSQPPVVSDDYLETTSMTALHETSVHLLASAAEQDQMVPFDDLGQRKPLSILIADDYDINRMVLESQLESLGYRADGVANGEEALRALHARDYDIVFMDIRMPVMDGVEATRRIRSRRDARQPYIAAVTASALKGDRDGYIAKPVDIVKLAQLLETAYDKVHANRDMPWDDTLVDMNPVKIHLDDLRARLGPATDLMLSKVAPVYLRELPGRLEKLADALLAEDVEQFGQYSHGLKGTSKSVGAFELADTCYDFEKRADQKRLPTREEFSAFTDLAERTARALKLEIKS